MEKHFEPLEIKPTTDGMIELIQGRNPHDEAVVIRISTDQVEQVIQSLKDVKAALRPAVGGVTS